MLREKAFGVDICPGRCGQRRAAATAAVQCSLIGGDGQHERRHAPHVLGVEVGARVEECPDHVRVADGNREEQGREAAQGDRPVLDSLGLTAARSN